MSFASTITERLASLSTTFTQLTQHIPPPVLRVGGIIIVCSTALTAVALIKILLSLRRPREFKDLPSPPLFTFLINFLTRKYNADEMRRLFPETIAPDVTLLWIFGRWQLVARHPELVREIISRTDDFPKLVQGVIAPDSLFGKFMGNYNIVMSNGETWKRQRKIVNPAFHKKNLAILADSVFSSKIKGLLEELEKIDKQPIEIHPWTQKFTLDVLGLSGFSFDFNNVKTEEGEYVKVYNRVMKGVFTPLHFVFPRLYKLPVPSFIRVRRDLATFEGLLKGIIAKRRAERNDQIKKPSEATDLLGLMIDSNEGDGYEALTDDELYHNMVVFFLAGHDTTATALAISLYFLAKHPLSQDKARAEVLRVSGNKDIPSYHDQTQFEYLHHVVKETLRLYPSVVQLPSRFTEKQTKLGNIDVPPGTMVSVDIFNLQRRKDVWGPDSDSFRPERFVEEGAKDRHPFGWIPFGSGSRTCIGIEFSIIEQRMLLGAILKKYRVELVAGHEDLKLKKASLLAPDHLLLRFVPLQ
eukprot:TRINITY_DN1708_c0_g1_i3.p1 TRINITY_DN1708_c0_g1~~TRINITY_DN1708_c0_g1_i3.p1  ORF type:complete len:526 (-),score=108.20 TRINITY_DN1708_c0_g1_i3:161-1738(-)